MTTTMRPSLPVNQPLSEQVAQEVRAKPRACFHNASLGLLFSTSESPLRRALYVEGKCYFISGFPADHAWLELDGEIIDPTLTMVVKKKIRLADKDLTREVRAAGIHDIMKGRRYRYEALRRYTYEEVYAHCVQQKGKLPITPEDVLLDAQWHALGISQAQRRAWGIPALLELVAPE